MPDESWHSRWIGPSAATDFDKAMAIQDHLRDTTQFRYDVNTSLTSGTRSIVDFLTKTKPASASSSRRRWP